MDIYISVVFAKILVRYQGILASPANLYGLASDVSTVVAITFLGR